MTFSLRVKRRVRIVVGNPQKSAESRGTKYAHSGQGVHMHEYTMEYT